MLEVPLHYQVSEYDCVPTTFLNAIAVLYDRRAVPPLVVRHIFAYSLDTVSPGGRLGRAGTSTYAIQLLGHWLNSYKTRKFSVRTEYLQGSEVHVRDESPILSALGEGGVAALNLYLGRGEWHFLLALRSDPDWVQFFDPYRRKNVRGLRDRVRVLPEEDGRSPNLAIRRSWLDEAGGERFTLGETGDRECLLLFRQR
jgi:hypothetical protein